MIHFLCPSCNAALKVPDNASGKKGPCPQCGQRLQVPQTAAANKTRLGVLPDTSHPLFPLSLEHSTYVSISTRTFPCPQCQTSILVDEDALGHMVLCSKCGTSFAALSDNRHSTASRFDVAASSLDHSGTKTHSGLGIASFLIALLVLGLDVILALVIAINVAKADSREPNISVLAQLLAGTLSMYLLNCLNLPLCLVGCGLGIVGLTAHRDRNNLFTWMGFLGNGFIIVAVVGFYCFSALTKVRG